MIVWQTDAGYIVGLRTKTTVQGAMIRSLAGSDLAMCPKNEQCEVFGT